MKYPVALAVVVLLHACSGNNKVETAEESEPVALQAKTVTVGDSTTFSITHLLHAYYQVKDALVEYDTAAANRAATALALAADSVITSGISDSLVAKTVGNFSGSIASEARALSGETDLVEKKRSFSMISENLYPLLQSIQYNETVIYHQMCPMAFNDNETAFWLSDNREVVNPYLGKKHPKYASGMLHCGEVKDSLAYAK